jgi:acyl carrier protein
MIKYRNFLKGRTMAILDEVKEVVCEQLDADAGNVTETSKFVEDLGADSLDVVELVMALEEKFDLEIPDEEAENIQTVADAVKYIEDNK